MLGRRDVLPPVPLAEPQDRETVRDAAIADAVARYDIKHMIPLGEGFRPGHDGRGNWSEKRCELFAETTRSGCITGRRSWARFQDQPNILVPLHADSDEASDSESEPFTLPSPTAWTSTSIAMPDVVEDVSLKPVTW